ncbi:MAG: hypothetical protein CM1200mP30_12010 [Pseudomonadota bacterium]|nr:MAG: hypothetical protein CM1200mP30_12010 [Pseudomonadota bacterium]
MSENLRGKPYDLSLNELSQGQGKLGARCYRSLSTGRYPSDLYGETYLRICEAIHDSVPGVHIHAFSHLK